MITRKTTYALRALCWLAAQNDSEPRLAAEISRRAQIPPRFLNAIFRELKQANVLTARRGRGGGYLLSVPAKEIRIARIVQVLDGGTFPFPCLSWDSPARCAECPGSGPCVSHRALERMAARSRSALEALTLADLVEEGGERADGASHLPLLPMHDQRTRAGRH